MIGGYRRKGGQEEVVVGLGDRETQSDIILNRSSSLELVGKSVDYLLYNAQSKTISIFCFVQRNSSKGRILVGSLKKIIGVILGA
jgi:hypothetical protein